MNGRLMEALDFNDQDLMADEDRCAGCGSPPPLGDDGPLCADCRLDQYPEPDASA